MPTTGCLVGRAELNSIPLYPELRSCCSPRPRVLEIFNGVARHHLISGDSVIQVFETTLTPLQHQVVLDLLGVPAGTYTTAPCDALGQ